MNITYIIRFIETLIFSQASRERKEARKNRAKKMAERKLNDEFSRLFNPAWRKIKK